jgi:hypothetical protein
MSEATVSVATEDAPVTPLVPRRSRRLQIAVAGALALSGPVVFAATAWAQGCSAG